MTKILVAIAATAILSTSAMAQDLGPNLAQQQQMDALLVVGPQWLVVFERSLSEPNLAEHHYRPPIVCLDNTVWDEPCPLV